MPTNMLVSAGSGYQTVDCADRLIPYFQAKAQNGSLSWQATPEWWAEFAEIGDGPRPRYAIVNIPQIRGATAAGNVAFNPDGPDKSIKVGQKVLINILRMQSGRAKARLAWVGTVIKPNHDRGSHPAGPKDTMSVLCADVRHDLMTIRIVGRFIAVPNGNGSNIVFYQQNWHADVNPGGRPNRLEDDAGYSQFAPYPDYGLENGEEPPARGGPDANVYKKKATYWLLADILQYIARHYGPLATEQSKWPWLPKAPSWLEWPDNFGSEVDATAVSNFNNAVGQNNRSTGGGRKGPPIDLQGMSILDAVHYLLDTAGGWTVNVEPRADGADFKAVMRCVRTRYKGDSNAIDLEFAAGGDSTTTLAKAIITGGSYERDGQNLHTMVGGSGDHVMIETLLSTKAADGPTMEYSHATERLESWKLEAGTGYTSETGASVQRANRLYPDVMTYLRVLKSYNFQAGTAFAAYSRANIPRPMWPTLLSMMTEAVTGKGSTSNDSDAKRLLRAQDFAGIRWQIQFEINTSGGTWVPGPRFDALEVLDNGNVFVPVLREDNGTAKIWRLTDPANPVDANGKLNITLRDVRATLVLPCDHGMTYAIRLASDNSTQNTDLLGIDGGNLPDADFIEPGYSRRHFIDLNPLYQLWLRINSYPRAQSDGGTVVANKLSVQDALRSDMDLLQPHIRKSMEELGRLQKGGMLEYGGWLTAAYPIGTQIKSLTPVGASTSPFPIRSVIRGVCWWSQRGKTLTGLKLG